MKKIAKFILYLINSLCVTLIANIVMFFHMNEEKSWTSIMFFVVYFFVIHIIPNFFNYEMKTKSLRNSKNGCELLRIFLFSTFISVIISIDGWRGGLSAMSLGSIAEEPVMWILNTLVIILVEASVFWNGIIRIYVSSKQLALRWRILGIICGWMPIVNIVVLIKLIRIVEAEVKTENNKILLDKERAEEQICKTKYPILLVHGVFFRDFRYLNYWGRIPEALQKNGAVIFYGNHQSASSVEDSAKELTERIKEIVRTTGCEKVNIIAHSKGGLDCRYALSMTGAEPYVASLTTINTPHRGCEFADYLLSKIPQKQQEAIAKTYNAAMKKLGDANPDFLKAVYDLTANACKERNAIVKDVAGVYYQSVGSKVKRAMHGRFPLNFTYQLVNYFDGHNDGLVGEKSFPWGADYELLTAEGKRGISHGDMIDLNRENFSGFDVREYYVQLVQKLKKKGF